MIKKYREDIKQSIGKRIKYDDIDYKQNNVEDSIDCKEKVITKVYMIEYLLKDLQELYV